MRHLCIKTVRVLFFLCIIGNALKAQSKVHSSNSTPVKNITLEFPDSISLGDKVYTLSTIWSEIKYNFVNIDHLKFNPDSLYKATIPLIIATKNDITYYDILKRFICAFGDGHTQLLNESYSWNDYFDYIPVGIKEFKGEYYFISIRKKSEIDSTLLGAKIIEIEGVPAIKYIEDNYFPTIAASTLQHKYFQATGRIGQGIIGSYFVGKARKRNGEIVNFSIQRNGETTRTKNDEYWDLKSPNKRQRISLDWKDSNAILKINTFDEKIIPALDSLMKIVNSHAKGLIIDLRNNGGGSTETAWQLQKYLTKGEYFLSFGAQTRINNGYEKSQGSYLKEYKDVYLDKAYITYKPDTVYVEKSFKRVECPVVILIGNFTFSACEDFLVNIYEVPNRPLMIGDKTGGSSGAPLVLSNLPNETSARICTLRELFPYSMKPFVGTGISPDIEIKEGIEDYLSGEDVVLNRALQALTNE
jgi:carboxyl-terminal processing protease